MYGEQTEKLQTTLQLIVYISQFLKQIRPDRNSLCIVLTAIIDNRKQKNPEKILTANCLVSISSLNLTPILK